MLAIWQWERYRVTAMLNTLPYDISESYCSNTKLYIILMYPHADGLKALD